MDRVTATEIKPGIFRLSGYFEVWGITINQFLIIDEKPMMIETGLPQHFSMVRKTLEEIIDPSKIAYFGVPHFEPDECGSIKELVELAPNAEVVSSHGGAYASLSYVVDKPTRGLNDGEVLDLGQKRIKHFFVPHVHSWDSSVFVEETERVAFTADLFMQKGDIEPVTDENRAAHVVETWQGYFGIPPRHHLLSALDKLEDCNLSMLAPIHGSALIGDIKPYFDVMREYANTGP